MLNSVHVFIHEKNLFTILKMYFKFAKGDESIKKTSSGWPIVGRLLARVALILIIVALVLREIETIDRHYLYQNILYHF